MERLTSRSEHPVFPGTVLVRGRRLGEAYFDDAEDYKDYADALERLAQYEDIGLSPDEIETQLATYSAVLCDVTNNKMSKTNYTLEAIRSGISDAQAEDCDRCDNTEQLKRYEEAEADGRLIILPVKEGTPLFVDGKIFAPHCKGQVHKVTDWYYSYPMIYKDFRGEHDYVIDPDGIGTSTFLTREEAEAALEGMK